MFNIVVSLTSTANRFSTLFILVTALCITTSCHNNKATQNVVKTDSTQYIQLPEPTAISAKERNYILSQSQEWYNKFLRNSGFNGGMIVAKNGNIIFERYNGIAHLFGKDTVTENTPMHVASISKTFTGMAILKLWQDGKLNLDDSLTKYFPGFNYPGVTIRTLLDHRSGLPNYLYFMEDLGWDKSVFVRNNDVLTQMINRKSEIKGCSACNTHYEYSNTNFVLLALIIEKITGKTLPEYLKETFFVPLQMKNTFIYTDADSAKATTSYDGWGKPFKFDFLDKTYGDKNVFTTPRDLLLWDRALYSGKIFKPETLQEAYKPYSNEHPGIKNYGLAWHMYLFPNGQKIIYHNGRWHGSNAVFTRIIQDSATIIVIGNRYDRNIYRAKELASVFGNYGEDDNEEGEGGR
ncbi:serine hydrolase domain-containing protein [Ferruginibacter albus]|uniref:serine hydrolase domain-containing protein n=1 Tax=Ferruginibacter albus TaxID=2875540 RepID=UPI001CC47BBA|nr:serine hydrolase domain-containing protein [Ferruginibacter albus]UAY53612.1 beta-lactamase family protein [Ferruginibacter albus]